MKSKLTGFLLWKGVLSAKTDIMDHFKDESKWRIDCW